MLNRKPTMNSLISQSSLDFLDACIVFEIKETKANIPWSFKFKS